MFINNTEVHSDCDVASALRNSLQLRLPAQEQKETFHSLAQGVFLTLLSMGSQPEKTKDELKVTIISESHNSCFPQRNPPLVSSVHYKSLFSTWHQSVPTGFTLTGIQTEDLGPWLTTRSSTLKENEVNWIDRLSLKISMSLQRT